MRSRIVLSIVAAVLCAGCYRVTVVTGAPPALAVRDLESNQTMGQSEAFPSPSGSWQAMSFEFSTKPATQAVVLEFTRVAGTCSPCPIFGELWLDDFVIEDVTTLNPQR